MSFRKRKVKPVPFGVANRREILPPQSPAKLEGVLEHSASVFRPIQSGIFEKSRPAFLIHASHSLGQKVVHQVETLPKKHPRLEFQVIRLQL
jgi:hypothetical protein